MMSSLTQREIAQENNDISRGASRVSRNEKATEQEEEVIPWNLASTIPDGRTTAWLQCAGSFSLLLNSFGLVNSFGVFRIVSCLDNSDETFRCLPDLLSAHFTS